MPEIDDLLDHLCEIGASFYQRGYAFGSTGNLSVRDGDDIWITPTGQSLRKLVPGKLALIDRQGSARSEARPSKEVPFHLASYRAGGDRVKAIVHLHSTYAVALSCLRDLNQAEPLPPITPYYLMRVAPLAVVPYHRPGSPDLGPAVEALAADHDCILLRNHGLIALGRTLDEAVDRAEELEETAKLFFLLRGFEVQVLTPGQLDEINRTFRS
jgi:3-dehydro-4-phosphotetronate decarboxylase